MVAGYLGEKTHTSVRVNMGSSCADAKACLHCRRFASVVHFCSRWCHFLGWCRGFIACSAYVGHVYKPGVCILATTRMGSFTLCLRHSNCNSRMSAAELSLLCAARMLQVVIAHGEQFGSTRVQQARQQQAWLAHLQAGLLSGHCFQRFLLQRCGANSQVTQICGHQAFAQVVSGMIRYHTSTLQVVTIILYILWFWCQVYHNRFTYSEFKT